MLSCKPHPKQVCRRFCSPPPSRWRAQVALTAQMGMLLSCEPIFKRRWLMQFKIVHIFYWSRHDLIYPLLVIQFAPVVFLREFQKRKKFFKNYLQRNSLVTNVATIYSKHVFCAQFFTLFQTTLVLRFFCINLRGWNKSCWSTFKKGWENTYCTQIHSKGSTFKRTMPLGFCFKDESRIMQNIIFCWSDP